MSSPANVVIIIAVVGYVIARQFQARRFSGNARRMLILPAVLAVLALDSHNLLDPHHRGVSAVLLIVGVILEVGMGCVWGFTTRIWRDASGDIWAKGTKATALAWTGMLLIRAALIGIGSAMGVAVNESGILLSLAALLLVRSAVVTWRAREMSPAYRVPAVG